MDRASATGWSAIFLRFLRGTQAHSLCSIPCRKLPFHCLGFMSCCFLYLFRPMIKFSNLAQKSKRTEITQHGDVWYGVSFESVSSSFLFLSASDSQHAEMFGFQTVLWNPWRRSTGWNPGQLLLMAFSTSFVLFWKDILAASTYLCINQLVVPGCC